MKRESASATASPVTASAHWTKRPARRWWALALAFTLWLTLGAGTPQSAEAQTFSLLYTFNSYPDGAHPMAGLVMDAKGNLFGTTAGGGMAFGGTVFKLTPSGNETVMHDFGGGTDGDNVFAGLIMDATGSLYGTTLGGGAFTFGTVYKVSSQGKESVLYSFAGGKDGQYPYAGLVMDAKGALYGTTGLGGDFDHGTVFKVTSRGKETVPYTFCPVLPCTDGALPEAGMIMDAKANLYGTTVSGGAGALGALFKLTKNGKEAVLYSFNGIDGQAPSAGLIMDAEGNLYGTTFGGGAFGFGVVFKLSRSGKQSVLYSFAGGPDGQYPYAGLVMDSKGNLYGTTIFGGGNGCEGTGCGTVFKVSKSGTETVLYSFSGGADGANPYAGLIIDAKGNLYGTAYQAGAYGHGTVFKLAP